MVEKGIDGGSNHLREEEAAIVNVIEGGSCWNSLFEEEVSVQQRLGGSSGLCRLCSCLPEGSRTRVRAWNALACVDPDCLPVSIIPAIHGIASEAAYVSKVKARRRRKSWGWSVSSRDLQLSQAYALLSTASARVSMSGRSRSRLSMTQK